MNEALPQSPHRRYNALNGDWILVSATRTARPWQGARDSAAVESPPRYDPACYLCPGTSRASGVVNPHYETTHAFTNDFPALLPEPGDGYVASGLFRAEPERGTCRVVCFSPRHDLHLGDMSPAQVEAVVETWVQETEKLGADYRWVQIFENRGEMMGASNPHPHGQIWAGDALPVEPAREDSTQRQHYAQHQQPLLQAYCDQETGGPREVAATDEWVAVVPFWATWPYETMLLPRRSVPRLPDLDRAQRRSLAEVLRTLISGYDRLFDRPFPYSMGWHGAPFDPGDVEHWTVHAHFYPPLLRSATVRKFMVGYELLAEAQRDLTPEVAAERIRAVVAAGTS